MCPSIFQSLLVVIAFADPVMPRLDEASYERWVAMLRPRAEESAWRAIPWRSELWPAVKEADREARPLLIWAMNGHPLACT